MLGKLREDYQPIPLPPRRSHAAVDASEVDAVPSPALRLQQQIARSVATIPEEKWSPRASVALIVSVSLALWLAIVVVSVELIGPVFA
ncbi:hypothetical protein [Sphingomonas sp.]|uniref:hypothetical protein n=1 Tax=Sphingomonas sp. TaxID=28214 RepID=UPI003B3BCFEE